MRRFMMAAFVLLAVHVTASEVEAVSGNQGDGTPPLNNTATLKSGMQSGEVEGVTPKVSEELQMMEETGSVKSAEKEKSPDSDPSLSRETKGTSAPASKSGEEGGADQVEQKGSSELSVHSEQPGSTDTKKRRRSVLKIEGKKMLPLRVLARPFSNIYRDKSLESPVVVSNVPALKPFYVYAKPTAEERELEDGWYLVGTNTRGKISGWMQAKDVLEWKQTMCLTYAHPDGRKPVLMFRRKADLEKLLALPDSERIAAAERYYRAIEEGNISKDFPVESIEPKRALDWKSSFYFLPILDFKEVELADREARLLKLTATTNTRADARESTDIGKNSDYRNNANVGSTIMTHKQIRVLDVDIVWLVDTTVSMRPYIDLAIKVVDEVSRKIAGSNEVNVAIRFGIWGYRDNVDAIPEIGYTVRNYTPELLPVDEFVKVLRRVDVTKVDSVDYPEDMFSGMSSAVNDTQWRDGAMRFVILLGDAPSHKVGHKWNSSGLDEKTLRTIADNKNISIYSIHILNPKAKRFQELAMEQYRTLATNPGMDRAAFREVLSSDREGFQIIIDDMADQFTNNIHILKDLLRNDTHEGKKAVEGGPNPASDMLTGGEKAKSGGEMAFSETTVDIDKVLKLDDNNSSEARKLANEMFKAALVKWIGAHSDARPPRDIVAWAVDKDLEKPDYPSMEVRLLINKRQLDSLATALDTIIKAGSQGMISGDDFFTSLQATTAMMTRDPNMIRQAKGMAGYIPEFLQGLPYKSQLMALDKELWESWSVDEQMEFIDAMYAKVEAYRKIHDSPEGWVRINPDDDPDEYIYPISLDLLP